MRSKLCVASLGLLTLAAPGFGAPALTPEAEVVHDWLREKADFYAARPQLMDEKGSGWKPYNRLKWFHEQRMVNGELPAPDARWKAWERKREIERHSGAGARNTWFSLGPANLAGRVLSLAFHPSDPNIVYGGSAGGGLWKSTDNGASWTAMTDELPSLAVGGVAVSPNDPNVVVIGTGEATFNIDRIGGVGILKSTDAGVTWSTTSLSYAVSSGHGFHFVEANPINGTLLAGATDGLWRSDDDGDTWAHVRTTGNYYDAKWVPGSSDHVYTVRGSSNNPASNVKISTDDGITWTKAGVGQPDGILIGKSKLAVTAADPNTVYAVYVNRSNSSLLGLYRSTDAGANWTFQTDTPNITGGQGWYNLSLVADPDDADHLITGGVQLFQSTDGGVTLVGTGGGVHVDHHVAVYEPGSNSAVWVGSDGGFWRSSNDGASWDDRNQGLVTYQFYDICVNNGPTEYFVMGGTQDNGTDKWSGTTTWSQGLFADGMVCNINPVNGKTVYAEIQFGSHYKNQNFGDSSSWFAINNGITGSGAWVTPVDQDQSVGNHLYTSTSAGIFRTTQGGLSWELVASHTARWISISRVDGNIVWTVPGSGNARVTTDDGNSWATAAPYGFATGNATKIHAHPTDPDAALVVFSGYGALAHVVLTTDLGASWTDVTGDFPSQPVNAIVVDPDHDVDWYIGTDVGVWKSDNGGVNWVPFETGFPNTVVEDLEIQRVQRKLVAGTHGRGAWEIDIPLATTSADLVEPLARNLMLDRPSPNPITTRTMLRYAARHDGAVSLSVYDVQGRLVSRLAEFSNGDGVIRTTPWLTDDVESGVYFAVLRAGNVQKSRKIVVAK